MAKVKVFQLAKELNLSSKELLYHLEELGIIVKGHMSVLTEDEVRRVKQAFSERKGEVKRKKVIIRKRPKVEEKPAVEIEAKKTEEKPEAVKTPVAPPKEEAKVKPEEEKKEAVLVVSKEIKEEKPEKEEKEKAMLPEPPPEPEVPAEKLVEKKQPEKIEEKKEEKPKKKKKAKEKEEFGEKKRKKRPFRRKKHRQIVIEMLEEEEEEPVLPQPEPIPPQPPIAQKEKKEKPKKEKAKEEKPKPITAPPKPSKRRIEMGETITVAELAKAMGVKAAEVIKKLMGLGVMATINQPLDYETAALVASEFDYEVKKGVVVEDLLKPIPDKPEDLKPRPPVVTVMGHVDHGKTSLLDAIRQTNVTAQEAGGITQHIGAYYVRLDKGEIVFLDTPGHEAFTAMRARGAQVTDIVILVVAADDGVMEQTREAINHAKEAGVPIVVAINKIDKPNANPERVKRELAELGLIPEEWGGETLFAEISAKKKIGIEELLELVLLQAEILELKANPNKPARGTVIEARLDKGRGPVATVLVREGTLRVGDYFVCGLEYGRVRAMMNDRGERIKEAGPSIPVEILGLSGVPQAGDELVVVESEKLAKEVSQYRQQKRREALLVKAGGISLENIYEKLKEGEVKELKLIVKADVQGSVEAIREALQKLSTDEVKVNIIHTSTGTITESDILLAAASHAIVIGFNVRPGAKVKELAQRENVDVRFYNVIYHLVNDIKDAMSGMLEPEYREKIIGEAEIRQLFKVPKVGMVAGCYVTSGKIERGAKIRILREGVVVYDGKLASLKRFKEDVKEVAAGYECGMSFENFQDIKVNDIVEAYVIEEVKRELASQPSRQG
jgi:translation initiation factor IF-2